ncbi:MAG: outer membrane lipoprotein carrier protein LolA [Saprospiraceae bacterium]|nr:outer membrane lipoprotein carrier protein LolA [Saprospiraceae bacterium]
MKGIFVVIMIFLTQSVWSQNNTYTKKNDSDPKAKVLLDKLKKTLDSYSSVEMKFTLTLEFPKKTPEVQKGNLIQAGKKFFVKMDQQDVYCDGKTTWVHFKKNKQVQVSDYDESGGGGFLSPKELLNMYQTGKFVYSITEQRTEKGSSMVDIEFKPLDAKSEFSKMRLTVNKTANKVISLRVFSKDGSRYILFLDSIIPNQKYDPSTFVFNAKSFPGVRVEDLRID